MAGKRDEGREVNAATVCATGATGRAALIGTVIDRCRRSRDSGRHAAITAFGLLAAIVAFAAAGIADAAPVEREGMRYDDTARVDGSKVVLNGVGVRGGALFKGYVAGLYLPKKESDPEQVLAIRGAKRIAVRMLLAVNGDLLAKTFGDGIRKNYKEPEIDALRERMDVFDAQVRGIGGVAKGDTIDLDYLPSAGTRLVVNGKPRGEAIPGDDFYTALLKMFIGERAIDKGLRAALLGQPGS